MAEASNVVAGAGADTGSQNGGGTEKKDKSELLKSALNFLVQGKRQLLIKDVQSAVVSFADSCQLLTEANGPLCFENAEAHFFYGKALLEQARLELAVCNEGAPGDGETGEDTNDEETGGEEEEEEEDDEDDEKENGEGEESNVAAKETETSTGTTEVDGKDSVIPADDEKKEEDISAPSPTEAEAGVSVTNKSEVVADEKPSTSTGATENGTHAEADKEGEEETSNLELAWEVLEIAKLGYQGQLKAVIAKVLVGAGSEEEKVNVMKSKLHLQRRLSETYSLLGEVATESENYLVAVDEFKTAIEILSEIEGEDSREVAQYYFQMGLAFSFGKSYQEAIDSFHKSKSIIERRISLLQAKIDNKQTAKDLGLPYDDPDHTEVDEIAELKELLPDLDVKVSDTLEAENDNKATMEEEVKEREIVLKNSPIKNPNPPTINDISHLVKKKKKAEDDPSSVADVPPAKRLCSDSDAPTSNGSNTA